MKFARCGTAAPPAKAAAPSWSAATTAASRRPGPPRPSRRPRHYCAGGPKWNARSTTSRTSVCAKPVTGAGAKPACKPFLAATVANFKRLAVLDVLQGASLAAAVSPGRATGPTRGPGDRLSSPFSPYSRPRAAQSRRSGRRKRCCRQRGDRTSNQALAAHSPRPGRPLPPGAGTTLAGWAGSSCSRAGRRSAKSTQAALLADRLGAVLTREPGGTAVGEALRRPSCSTSRLAPAPKAEALLMLAARAQHVAEVIESGSGPRRRRRL